MKIFINLRSAMRGSFVAYPLLTLAIVVTLLLTAAPSFAQAPEKNSAAMDVQRFDQANKAYQQGHFEEAADGYRQLAEQGTDDAAVWYNLGNAYAQLDDLGRARVCFERALRLSPRDGDVRANLSTLMQKLVDKETDEDPLLHYARWFTMNELAITSSVLWLLTAVLFAAWLRRRHEATGWLCALSLGLLLCCGGLFALRYHADADARQAVVIPGEVKLFNGPGRDYTPSISLHAGTRVQVLRSEGDWREIGAFNHVSGWLRAEELESI